MEKATLLRYFGMFVMVFSLVYMFQGGLNVLNVVFLILGFISYIAGLILKTKTAAA
jgi:phage-related holin